MPLVSVREVSEPSAPVVPGPAGWMRRGGPIALGGCVGIFVGPRVFSGGPGPVTARVPGRVVICVVPRIPSVVPDPLTARLPDRVFVAADSTRVLAPPAVPLTVSD